MFLWQAHDTRKRYRELKRKYPGAIILLESGDEIYQTYDDSADYFKNEFKDQYYTNARGQAGLSVPRNRLEGRLKKLDSYAWTIKEAKKQSAEQDTAEKKPLVVSTMKPRPVEKAPEKSCDNCQLRKSGACSQIKNTLCGDYLAIPFVSQAEKDSWPEYGDATAFSLGEKRT